MENISLSFSLPFRGRGELYIDGTMHKAVNKQQRAVSLSQITFFFWTGTLDASLYFSFNGRNKG